jgi:asparagine synthase (glutamine-hydrolysing)
MCGIAGLFRRDGNIDGADVRAIECATLAQSHRGPDDSGFYHDSRAALGHRRLSIIDLSPAGHQPMCNEDSSIWITYNGEIYNCRELRAELKSLGHNFRSNSDTEIVIHGYEAWGIAGLLKRLEGMFAFGLYDSRLRSCILARDRFGIKPLYYHRSAGGESLVFASEVKALVRSGLAPDGRDSQAIIGFLLFGSVPAPATSVKGVCCLLPGYYLIADRNGISTHQYWDLKKLLDANPQRAASESGLGELLEDTVQRHLISDVPVGIFLSGGVDSVGLVALASRRHSKLTTLTVVFDEKEFSEAAPARRAAEHFRTQHREILVTSRDFLQELPNFFRAMDQPTNDGVNTYFVARAARQAGLTVVLSGLGGDEIFCGYRHHRWVEDFSRVPAPLQRTALRIASQIGGRFGEKWARLAPLPGQTITQSLYMGFRGFFTPEQIARLLDVTVSEVSFAAETLWAGLDCDLPRAWSNPTAFSAFEIRRYMHDQLLRDTDVFGMASSIEARVPYLDHRVIERIANVSPTARFAPGLNKPLLVNAIDDPIVRDAAIARKKGFTFPLQGWIRQSSNELEEMSLQSNALQSAGVRYLWQGFRENHLHWSRAWALAVLGAES